LNQVLEFVEVQRSYRKKNVLSGVSFSLEAGEVVGLLGKNGAGKTTLLRIAMGMLFPDGGAVRVFGLDPKREAVPIKRRVGFVAEDQVLPPNSRISELIALHRHLFPRWDTAMEGDLLDLFELSRQTRIKHLSKGQSRQVALLCAICHRPELLILDEPGGGLDPVARRDFLEASVKLLNREGCAILFSSHHMTDVERIGARIVLLADGKVRLDTELDRIRESICLAIVPKSSAPQGAMEGIPGLLRVRPVGENWHAILEHATPEARQLVQEKLGGNGVRCAPLSLEDLFVEMVGGARGDE